jgi:hypothetical protein
LWHGDDLLARRAFFERRRAAYALADFHVDAAGSEPEAVASAIETRRRAIWVDFIGEMSILTLVCTPFMEEFR